MEPVPTAARPPLAHVAERTDTDLPTLHDPPGSSVQITCPPGKSPKTFIRHACCPAGIMVPGQPAAARVCDPLWTQRNAVGHKSQRAALVPHRSVHDLSTGVLSGAGNCLVFLVLIPRIGRHSSVVASLWFPAGGLVRWPSSMGQAAASHLLGLQANTGAMSLAQPPSWDTDRLLNVVMVVLRF